MYQSNKLLLSMTVGIFLFFPGFLLAVENREYSLYNPIDMMEFTEGVLSGKLDIKQRLEPHGISAIIIAAGFLGDIEKTDKLLEMGSDVNDSRLLLFICSGDKEERLRRLDKHREEIRKISSGDSLEIRRYVTKNTEKAFKDTFGYSSQLSEQDRREIEREADDVVAVAVNDREVIYQYLDQKIGELEQKVDARNGHLDELRDMRTQVRAEVNIFSANLEKAQEYAKAMDWINNAANYHYPEVLRHVLNKANPEFAVSAAKTAIEWFGDRTTDVCKECLSILEEYIKEHSAKLEKKDL